MPRKFDTIIVGSGAGGATLARELCKKGRDVLVIEAGANTYPLPFVLEKSMEGTDIFTAYGRGGATVLSNGNGVRSLQKELGALGIELENEFQEMEQALGIAPIHESLLSEEGSLKILKICKEKGLQMRRMPKFMDHTKCKRCGNCSLGCPTGAKWTAVEFLRDAEAHGLQIVYDTRVDHVLMEKGRAKGVAATGPAGATTYLADVVVLAAGGLKTPVILQNSGFNNAGRHLSIDVCELWYGVTSEIDISDEPPMQLVDTSAEASEGFMLSIGRTKNKEKIRYYLKEHAEAFLNNNWISVIVKIADDTAGAVHQDGTFSKGLTELDRLKLDRGGEAARNFLLQMGGREETIIKRQGLYGGHNVASAAIGEVVDTDLQTEVDNLFVCDASVIPKAPGLPPILTITALAKRLSNFL